MIQLLLAPYNDKEVEKLSELLCKAHDELVRANCQGRHCESCQYKHICDDLEKARKFAREVRK